MNLKPLKEPQKGIGKSAICEDESWPITILKLWIRLQIIV